MDAQIDYKAVLAGLAGWPSMTAYERTKRACALLTEQGEAIPMWNVLREIIGKGSAQDINRGKADFRREHGEALRALAVFPDGMPSTVRDALGAAWSEMAKAGAAVADQRMQVVLEERDTLESRLEEAVEASGALQEALDHSLANLRHTEDKSNVQQREITALEASLTQANAWLQETRDESARQRQELEKAVDRLEGVETHMLRRVEEVRQEVQKAADREIASLKAKLQDMAMEQARALRRAEDATAERIEIQESMALAKAAINEAVARAVRAEAALADLQSVIANAAYRTPGTRQTKRKRIMIPVIKG